MAENNSPATTKKRTTTKPAERDTRKELIDRVVADFTFKADTTDAQKAAFGWIRGIYSNFTQGIKNLFDYSQIPAQLVLTDEFKNYETSIREAERWANTAIANNWKDGDTFDEAKTGGLVYPLIEADKSEIQRLCYEVTKMCFELATNLAENLPEGRALSLLCTEMQVARGWLLDCINLN